MQLHLIVEVVDRVREAVPLKDGLDERRLGVHEVGEKAKGGRHDRPLMPCEKKHGGPRRVVKAQWSKRARRGSFGNAVHGWLFILALSVKRGADVF